jgi:hypothetical protein
MKTKLTPAFVMNAKVDDDPAFGEGLAIHHGRLCPACETRW